MPRISPYLCFDGQARAVVGFYVSIFPTSKIPGIHRYGQAGQEQHGQTPGSVMTVKFELDGHRFTALKGGPHFQFTPAVSFVVNCKTKAEVNLYRHRLFEGGAPEARQYGWRAAGWGFVADRAGPSARTALRPGNRRTCHAGDEENRHRGARARLRRLSTIHHL